MHPVPIPRGANFVALLAACSVAVSRLTASPAEGAEPAPAPTPADEDRPPNFVVIFCDDLGYGDLSSFGHPTIRTPHLDRMAAEGQKWTSFYAAASVCTPSRAGLLTGRLPIRSGMCSDRRRVLFPDSAGGLPPEEITIAELLRERGYATGCVGKWHLGHLPEFLPTAQGFDTYFGIPYSNDMDRVADAPPGRAAFLNPKSEYWNVPLMRGTEIVERPATQETLTRRYTEEAVAFIESRRDRPFFLYLAHSMPHVPLFRSESFGGRSTAGLYGDVIEEIDWSTGEIRAALERHGLTRRTLIVFTSDNGPWLVFGTHGGSAGPLRDGKGSTWEGGMREPTIFCWPGTIEPSIRHEIGSTLDLLPTFASLAHTAPPTDRPIDGHDLGPVLRGAEGGVDAPPRNRMFFYHGEQLFAVREGRFKAHFLTKTSYVGRDQPARHDPPLLFDLALDPSERFDIASDHPDVVAAIRRTAEEHTAGVDRIPSRLELRVGNP